MPSRLIVTVTEAPARRVAANGFSATFPPEADVSVSRFFGHPRPVHETVIAAPAGTLRSTRRESFVRTPLTFAVYDKMARIRSGAAAAGESGATRTGGLEPVSGGGCSCTTGAITRHARSAGVGSKLPAASRARTRSTWSPSVRPSRTYGLAQAANASCSSRHSNVAPGSDANTKRALVA